MGRLALLLLVLVIVALGARVIFVEASSPEEATLQTAPKVPVKPVTPEGQKPLVPPADPELDSLQPITIVDPDPDLDQSSEPADCPGTPEPLPEPQEPSPH